MLPKFVTWILTAVVFVLLLGVGATWYLHHSEVDTVSDEHKIARTLEILNTSTPTDKKVLKVLFYGQSITRAGWDKLVIEHWHQKYPNTLFVVQNLALGGFASPMLARATERDIADFYPDLIIFHEYGDHHAYEEIIRYFRSETAADVIVQTDHGESLPDPPCMEGLRSTLRQQPGCTGLLWVKQRNWYDRMSYHKIPVMARKYGLALEPQRIWWRDYLLRNHIDPQSLLADDIHPNAKGNELFATFLDQYIDGLVDNDKQNPQTQTDVVSIPANTPQTSNGQETVNFNGSRLELIASKHLATWPTVAIDGGSPNDIDGCFLATRTSSIGTVFDWPALRRVTLQHDRVPEEWKATLTKISEDQKTFEFTVVSSVFGDEGSGDSSHDFLSKSGKLTIEPQDWMVQRAFETRNVPLQVPFEVSWSVNNICSGKPEVIDRGDGTKQYRYVVGAGLTNAKHVATLSAPANDFVDTTEFRAYSPPLHQ